MAWQKATGYGRRSHAEMVCSQSINFCLTLKRAAWCCRGAGLAAA